MMGRPMEIKSSRHGKRQMKWREIDELEVKSAIETPDTLLDSVKGRKNAFKDVGGRFLKVTYKTESEEIVVITAMVKGE